MPTPQRSQSEKPTIAVVSHSDLTRDPRVDRQLRWLKDDFHVVAIGWGPPAYDDVDFVPLVPIQTTAASDTAGTARTKNGRLQNNGSSVKRHGHVPRARFLRRVRESSRRFRRAVRRTMSGLRKLVMRSPRLYERRYWQTASTKNCHAALRTVQPQVIVANDIETLPAALDAHPGIPVLFDAHEYAPREYDNLFLWRLLEQSYKRYLCHRYIPRTAAMTTVCPAIAHAYLADTGVNAVVVTNAAPYRRLEPSEPASDGRIRLVHHGMASRSRGTEDMLRIIDLLDERFTLDVYLVAGDAYRTRLQQRFAHNPRLRFRAPVPMRSLIAMLNSYDMGLYLLAPKNFNHRYALPNKLFEFVQARLGVAIGPSPEMADFVRAHGVGVVSDDFRVESLAARLNSLSSSAVQQYKRRCHQVARSVSDDTNRERFIKCVQQLLPSAGNRMAEGNPETMEAAA